METFTCPYCDEKIDGFSKLDLAKKVRSHVVCHNSTDERNAIIEFFENGSITEKASLCATKHYRSSQAYYLVNLNYTGPSRLPENLFRERKFSSVDEITLFQKEILLTCGIEAEIKIKSIRCI